MMKELDTPQQSTIMKKKDTLTRRDIQEGLELKQFEVHYQPIIDKLENRIICGEALVRWKHPELGLLHPDSFIELAERTEMIGQLGEFVLREAASQSKIWKEEGLPFYKVTVNLSLGQLSDMKFPGKVGAILKEFDIAPGEMELEITETMAMIDPEETKSTLLELKDVGIRIVLDDFGTGYSSLSHIRHFPIDGLKIDGEFIRHSLQSDRNTKLMHSIILLAKALDLQVVAEGVETEEQAKLLFEMECHIIQGFYFTHPLPSEHYKEWCLLFTKVPALRV
jgi:EAL domain-containing protein (putative c-di-GMP-specific phosphodiesterase class I)